MAGLCVSAGSDQSVPAPSGSLRPAGSDTVSTDTDTLFLPSIFPATVCALPLAGYDAAVLVWDVTGCLAAEREGVLRLSDEELSHFWVQLADDKNAARPCVPGHADVAPRSNRNCAVVVRDLSPVPPRRGHESLAG